MLSSHVSSDPSENVLFRNRVSKPCGPQMMARGRTVSSLMQRNRDRENITKTISPVLVPWGGCGGHVSTAWCRIRAPSQSTIAPEHTQIPAGSLPNCFQFRFAPKEWQPLHSNQNNMWPGQESQQSTTQWRRKIEFYPLRVEQLQPRFICPEEQSIPLLPSHAFFVLCFLSLSLCAETIDTCGILCREQSIKSISVTDV